MPGLQAAAAAVDIPADDDMILGGSILPATCVEQEAPLRATAVVLVGDATVCLVSLDVIGLGRRHADQAAQQIADRLGIPFENILITATHTHHAPTTMTVHAYSADEEFCARTVAAAVQAGADAFDRLQEAAERPNECEAELLYAPGIETTIGHNSRWFMDDGQVTWCGHDPSLALRPSGPHDPDLPVLAVRRPTGQLVSGLFCHGTHNIGTLSGAVRSPGVFGLAAQELERRHGGVFLFAPGAFGSSHRPDGVSPGEAVTRIVAAVGSALGSLRPALHGPLLSLKRPFSCTHRTWDEAEQDAAVRRWCERWFDPATARTYIQTFAQMREAMAPTAGQPFDTWLQVVRLGEVAIVGVPGEMFAALGLEIRRRSPFRRTIVVGLANDEVGYIPDRQGYLDGGYQTWVGLHSQLEPGTGEAMVEAALAMLHEAHAGSPADEAAIDSLRPGDGVALQRLYNGLAAETRRLFRPLGWNATFRDCAQACSDATEGRRRDYVLRLGNEVVGWAFLTNWEQDVLHLGIGIADDQRGKGYGKRLMQRLIADARLAGKQAIELIHVKTNEAATGLYRSLGFRATGEYVGADGNDYWEMRLAL